MIDIVRVVEYQASLSSYRATQNEERAEQLELLIELSKPKNLYSNWHPLIATPFRYSPPHPMARFRPPFGKNVFYGSLVEETALYEHAFHFIQQRKHLSIKFQTGIRTLFLVGANDKQAIQINNNPNIIAIMDKHDYSASHQFIINNPQASFILYPSCRDPKTRANAAVLDINHLEKNPKSEITIKFFYNNKIKQLTWIDYRLAIQWVQVS